MNDLQREFLDKMEGIVDMIVSSKNREAMGLAVIYLATRATVVEGFSEEANRALMEILQKATI